MSKFAFFPWHIRSTLLKKAPNHFVCYISNPTTAYASPLFAAYQPIPPRQPIEIILLRETIVYIIGLHYQCGLSRNQK